MTDAAANRPLRIFLCHASNDKPAVRDLYRRLAADGFAPWLDEEDLLPGQKWRDEIPKAVRNSDVVLVCLSQHSINKTGYVQKEIKFALDVADEQPDGAIFLIPLRLENCDVPERLSHLQWVNFYDEGGYARLLRALRRRVTDLNASVPVDGAKPASPSTPEARSPVASNVSGGVNVDADSVTVGNDVVGRDKIIQAGTYIEHAVIYQPLPPGQTPPLFETKSEVIANRVTTETITPWIIAGDARHETGGAAANVKTRGGLQFVCVPAGKFLMGSRADNKLAQDNEHLQHTVEIPYDYWLAHYPVTNEQFAQFLEATAYEFSLEQHWKRKADHPVVNVTWHTALAYSQWLNDLAQASLSSQGLAVRLPTEAEWEKAARGTQGNEWPWGNEFDQTKCNSSVDNLKTTTPVGAYSPHGDNPYGATDMVGNVWEWCHSLFKPYPYRVNDGRESEDDLGTRVLRGGSFISDLRNTRAANRLDYDPGYHSRSVGFRVVMAPGLK